MIWWTRSCEKVGVLAERKCGHALNVVLREKNDMMWQGTLSSTSIYPFPAAFVVLSSQDETNWNLIWNINILCLSNFISIHVQMLILRYNPRWNPSEMNTTNLSGIVLSVLTATKRKLTHSDMLRRNMYIVHIIVPFVVPMLLAETV